MSATPTKSSKRGRKKDGGCNDRCRFCSCFFENSGTRASFENLFSKSARKESPGTVLADCCSSMGFPLIKSPSVSERVCRSCGRKIRNASELYGFIQTAVSCSNDSATGNKTEESDLQECSSKWSRWSRCFDVTSIWSPSTLLGRASIWLFRRLQTQFWSYIGECHRSINWLNLSLGSPTIPSPATGLR